MLLTDLCNRPSTRAPVNRSSTERATCAAPTAGCFPPEGGSPVRRRTILRQSGPGWPPLDGGATSFGHLRTVLPRRLLSEVVASESVLLPPHWSVVVSRGAA